MPIPVEAVEKRLPMHGLEPYQKIETAGDLTDLFQHIRDVWQAFGETDPHWSVLTNEDYRTGRFEDHRAAFYGGGEYELNLLLKALERSQIDAGSLKTCLEYGCGVGRVTWQLARQFDRVDAYDISAPHLELAREWLDRCGADNATLHHVTDPENLAGFPKVDAVFSVIVLQHNPPPMILQILRALLNAVNPGGIAYFQVPTWKAGYRFQLDEYLEGQFTENVMEMHVLPQHIVFAEAHKTGFRVLEVLEDARTGPHLHERSNTFVLQRV